MNIPLKPFQKQRVHELRETAAVAQMNWQHFRKKQIISFTAPTGAGKTIMMASFIEAMMCGDDEGMMAAIPESIFIWLSDSPELNEQSKQKLMRYCNRLVLGQFVTLDESFRGDKLEQGKVYFLNTQKLTRTSRMTQIGDGRDWTIWEVLENTIEEYGKNLILVIDEAHRGAKTSQTTIMQKFVLGVDNEEEKLQSLPFIIGMSATPERFNALAGTTYSTISKVVVTPAEVRGSGLLKDKIEIHFPEDSVINKNIAVLQAAADEWKDKCLHWYNYTEKQHYQNVCPIFVVQVESGTTGKVSTTDLDECLREIEKRIGETFVEGEVVHSFGEIGTLTINGIKVPYCAPSAINDDRKIKVVLFKEALSTGWDCPRAEAMMSYRVAKDATYIAQLLGRMIRTPLRMRVEVDETLNYVHLYLPNFDENTVEDVVKKLTEEEGGELPTDIQAIQGGNKTSVVMTAKRPNKVLLPRETTTPHTINPSSSDSLQTVNTNVQTTKPTDADPIIVQQQQDNPAHHEFVQDAPKEMPEQQDPFEVVKEAINNAEILTYDVKNVAVNKNYVRSLFDLAHLAVLSGMDESCKAVDNVKDAIVELIHNYVEQLKRDGEYKALVDKALEFQLNTISFELPQGNGSLTVNGTVQDGCVLKVKIRSENGVHSFTPAQVAAGEATVHYNVPYQTAVVIYISNNGSSPAPKRAPAAVKDEPKAALTALSLVPTYPISANVDPDHAGVYYSTHFNETQKYILPAGTEAYVATISGSDMNLTKVVNAGEVLPANTAVILKSTSASVVLTPTDAAAVTISATNDLHGVDFATAAPANCYVLSGHSTDNSVTGVGFYEFTGTIPAHKAYLTVSGGAAYAPKKLRFIFNEEQQATGMENAAEALKSEKRIENGQLIIIKNGVRYNAQGQVVK